MIYYQPRFLMLTPPFEHARWTMVLLFLSGLFCFVRHFWASLWCSAFNELVLYCQLAFPPFFDRKLVVHYSSSASTPIPSSLCSTSCSEDDPPNSLVFLWCKSKYNKDERERLGCSLMWEGHANDEKWSLTCSPMLLSTSAFKYLKVGYFSVTLGHSMWCSHKGFNQSKPIFLPFNAMAIGHRESCSMSYYSIEILHQNASRNALSTLHMRWPHFVDFPNLWYNK